MKILFDKGCYSNLIYKFILKNKINEITKRIGKSFSEVQWIIFDSNKSKIEDSISLVVSSPFLKKGHDYGYCIVKSKTIYISLDAIRGYSPPAKIINELDGNRINLSLLTKVIIDELAHIETGKDHGEAEYNKIYKEFVSRCNNL